MKNVIILVLSILFLLFLFLFWGGSKLTSYSINSSITELRDSINFSNNKQIDFNEIENLPEILQKYFKKVITKKTNKPQFITVKQSAQFKTDENSEWKPITATEYFTTDKINFLWDAVMSSSNFFWVRAIDSYINGKGNMLIKLNSSITITDAWSIEMDKSGLVRYLSEALLFPTSLLPNKHLVWNVLDSNSAEIKFSNNNYSVVAKVFFAEDGTIYKLETMDKYRTTDAGYVKTLYSTNYYNYKLMKNGFYVPTYVEVEWTLPEGNFKYGKFNIDNIIYE